MSTVAYSRRTSVAASALLAALVFVPAARAEQPDYTGRAIVHLRAPELRAFATNHGLAPRGLLRKLGRLTVAVPRDEGFTALRRRLARDPRVRGVERELRLRFRFTPNDPAFNEVDPDAPGAGSSYQWHLVKSGFPSAWDRARGSDVKVGVIDSGIDATHPDLGGQIEAAVSQNTGLLDVVLGGDDPRTDQNGHGSHVSGLACADANNGFGIASAGFDCRIILEKTDLTTTSIAASIIDATDRGARVINMSLGGPGTSSALEDAIDYALSRDVVLVAAAANEQVQDQGIPANILQPTDTGPDIEAGKGLVVTAAQFDGTRASFAGFGTQISIAAYGDSSGDTPGIFSTFPTGITELELTSTEPPFLPCFCRASFDGDSRFAYLVGASMATPQVAGAVALVRSANPSLDARAVIKMLKLNASGRGVYGIHLGWGIVDAGRSVSAALGTLDTLGAEAKPPTSRARAARRTRKRRFRVAVKASDASQDGLRASGVRYVDAYVARNRARRYRRVKRLRPGKLAFRFKGRPGNRYRFYSRATDSAGNREPAPRRPDVIVRIRKRR